MTINSGLKLHHPLHAKPSNPESVKTGKPLEKAAENQVIININKVIRNGNESVHTDEIEKQIVITIKDEQKLKHYKKFGLEIDDKKYELGQIDTIYHGHERENEADRIRGRFARNLANGGVHLEIRTATESSKKSKYDSIRNSEKLHEIQVKKEENSNNKETDNNNRLRERTPLLSSNSPTPSPPYVENRNSDVENTPDTDDSLQSLDNDFEDQDPPELDRWGGAQASLMYGFDLESFYAEASDESEDDNSDTDEDHDVENEDIGRDVMPPMDIAKLISVEEKGIPMEDDFDVNRLSDEEKIEEIDNYIDTILNIMQSSHGLRNVAIRYNNDNNNNDAYDYDDDNYYEYRAGGKTETLDEKEFNYLIKKEADKTPSLYYEIQKIERLKGNGQYNEAIQVCREVLKRD